MKKDIDTKNLINDFLNDRLTDQARLKFLKLYSSLIKDHRNEADHIFDNIQEQIDALTQDELSSLFEKLETLNSKRHKTVTIGLGQSFLKYAAIIIAALFVGFWYLKDFNGKTVSYLVKADQLILLPDSSSVVLKAGSSLIFDSSYGKAERQVKLDGEGFFEVKPNKQKPFIVHSPQGLFTKVLGTSFLMTTSSSLNKVKVKTGRVEVGDVDTIYAVLLPGDQLIKKANKNIEIHRHQVYKVFEFNNLDLRAIALELADHYGRSILIDKSVPQGLKYTATFSSNQSLEEIVMTISAVHHLKYKITPNNIVVSK